MTMDPNTGKIRLRSLIKECWRSIASFDNPEKRWAFQLPICTISEIISDSCHVLYTVINKMSARVRTSVPELDQARARQTYRSGCLSFNTFNTIMTPRPHTQKTINRTKNNPERY